MRYSLESVLRGHPEQICHLAFSPDGTLLSAGCLDGSVWIWDMQARLLLRALTDSDAPRPAIGLVMPPRQSFSPDGSLLAVSIGNGLVRLYNESGERVATLSASGEYINDVVFSPSGRFLLTAGKAESVQFWDMRSGNATWQIKVGDTANHQGHATSPSPIRRVALSSDARLLTLLTDAGQGEIHQYLIDEEHASASLIGEVVGHARIVTDIVYSPDNSVLVVCIPSERCAAAFDARKLDRVSSYCIPDDVPVGLTFALNGYVLAIAGGRTGTVWLWDMGRSELVAKILSHPGGWGRGSPAWKAGAIAASHSGDIIAVAGMDTPDGVEDNDQYHGPVDWTIKIWKVAM